MGQDNRDLVMPTAEEKILLGSLLGKIVSVYAVQVLPADWLVSYAADAFLLRAGNMSLMIVPRVCSLSEEDWNGGPIGVIDCSNSWEADTAHAKVIPVIESFDLTSLVAVVFDDQYEDDGGVRALRFGGLHQEFFVTVELFYSMTIHLKPESVAELDAAYACAGARYESI